MSVFKIQPHHLEKLFEVYLWGIDSISGIGYGKIHRAHIKKNLTELVQEPSRKIQLVSGGDSLCCLCPYNIDSSNYNPELSYVKCGLSKGKITIGMRTENLHNAMLYGLKKHLDKDPVSVGLLLEKADKYGIRQDNPIFLFSALALATWEFAKEKYRDRKTKPQKS